MCMPHHKSINRGADNNAKKNINGIILQIWVRVKNTSPKFGLFQTKCISQIDPRMNR